MTDLEREASEIVRDLIDACADALSREAAVGHRLVVDGSLDLSLAQLVDHAPFESRIVEAARAHERARLAASEATVRFPAIYTPRPRTTELL